MPTDDHVTDLLPAYALGCLDEEEAGAVVVHLASCDTCRAELRTYQATCGELVHVAPTATPSRELKGRVMAAARQARSTQPAAASPSLPERIAGLLRLRAPAWGAVGLALVTLLIVSNVWWWQRSTGPSAVTLDSGMRVIDMAGVGAASEASGTLVISDDGEYGTLVVDGLPSLPADRQYQLWLIRDGQRTNGGVFSVSLEGYGALVVASPDPLSSYPGFGVTIEPAGGSPSPTGDQVLAGTL
ncbi:MAG: anti-sigma factor [Anaerolineae bacterium]|nr:anti-sigma factor [Anaerolineae bacterium]